MLRNRKIIIGTRGSRLSLAQTEHFRDELLLAYPGVTADQLIIKIIKTSGDKFKTEKNWLKYLFRLIYLRFVMIFCIR